MIIPVRCFSCGKVSYFYTLGYLGSRLMLARSSVTCGSDTSSCSMMVCQTGMRSVKGRSRRQIADDIPVMPWINLAAVGIAVAE